MTGGWVEMVVHQRLVQEIMGFSNSIMRMKDDRHAISDHNRAHTINIYKF